MIPIPIPEEAAAGRPYCVDIAMGPPPGVPDEECGTVHMLREPRRPHQPLGPAHYAYFRPTHDELMALASGGFLELALSGGTVQPFGLAVWAVQSGDEQQHTQSIYDEIRAERERAHAKHGDTSMESAPIDAMFRAVILGEEIGEVAEVMWSLALTAIFSYVQKTLNDGRHDGTTNTPKLRRELVQVATMAAAWADRIPLDDARC